MKMFVLPHDKNPSGTSPRSDLEEVLREGARKKDISYKRLRKEPWKFFTKQLF